ncbi:CTQ-dependent glycine oxidase GoxA [Marinomonas algicola]|uniref:CTQ-dependent glycine oxidase GoxA n=1 Tax=Marinomonas algicola TaxID=2773454 RepID=UPI00174E73CC|nr:CTQ-dependent glycine oxidase GoxA [Marinomonas algicola]
MNHDDHNTKGVKRRDFLAMAGSVAILGSFPLMPKSAIAATGKQVAPDGAKIHRLGIYPAIGICRVGGSQQYFLAPEVPGLPPQPDGGFKDGTQAIKKQAQRFRVYAFDDQDRVIGEIKDEKGSIEWRVHLANTKAAWYGFNNPLDNGELAPGIPGMKRNQYFVSDKEREKMLVIDGKQKTISGTNKNSNLKDKHYEFIGQFWGEQDVALGKIKTDEVGRLIVIPPDGVSKSPTNAPITSFADNDGWHDDWGDGPVQAKVTFPDGTVMEADTAWVACIGPNFAPEIPPVTTLYDAITNMNVKQGWTDKIETPISFRKYIYPIFRRLGLMEWVSSAANLRQGWLGVGDFSDPDYIAKLADPSIDNVAFRRDVFSKFRNPHNTSDTAYLDERLKMPMMLGDGINFDGSPLQWFQFTDQQYRFLSYWSEGLFVNDFEDVKADNITRLDDLDLALQPDALTEAALEPCSGGAFHPGVELTYYLRVPQMYARNYRDHVEPFRLAHKERTQLGQNVGRLLTLEKAINGDPRLNTSPPLGHQWAGDLTRWMGLPWQCDAFSCQQVLMQEDFPTAVWWPALLPVDVLPEKNYQQLMNDSLSDEERVKFFENRADWKRGVAGIGYHANASYWDGITNMIALWERMGFIVRRDGPSHAGKGALSAIPKEMFVEVDRGNVESRFDWKPKMGDLPN